jgi:hypothetical protein
MRLQHHACQLLRTTTVAFTGITMAVLLPVLAAPAAAIPSYADSNFRCLGVDGVLDRSSLAQPGAGKRWATWGLPTVGNGRVLYGDSRIQIISLTKGSGSDDLLFQTRPARKQRVVECRNAYSGQVARIALVDPPPAAPPAIVSSGVSAPLPLAGRYEDWVIRSLDDSSGCFLASARDHYQVQDLRRFCFDDPRPGLWDVVDIDHTPDSRSNATVTGTLTRFHRPQ